MNQFLQEEIIQIFHWDLVIRCWRGGLHQHGKSINKKISGETRASETLSLQGLGDIFRKFTLGVYQMDHSIGKLHEELDRLLHYHDHDCYHAHNSVQ